jgi:hypothetical protein
MVLVERQAADARKQRVSSASWLPRMAIIFDDVVIVAAVIDAIYAAHAASVSLADMFNSRI